MPEKYVLQLDNFHIDSAMAGGPVGIGSDTDYVYCTLKVGNQIFARHEFIGDVGRGDTRDLTWAFGPMMVGDGVPLLLSYQIVNHGHDDAAKRAADDIKIAEGITGAIGTIVGLVFPPAAVVVGIVAGALGGIGDVASWLLGHINCDGMVLNDSVVANGNILNVLTGAGGGTHRETRQYTGPETPSGCGSDAQYRVTWSVTVQPTPPIDLGAADGPVQAVILNKNSGLCLDVPGGDGRDNVLIQQYTINNGPNQHWTITQVGNASDGDPVYTITSVASGKCLDVPNGSADDNVQIQQYQCHGGPNQQWKFVPVGNGYYAIRNAATGLYFDIPSGSIDDSTILQQYHYNGGGDNQKWKLVVNG
jgi:hypothetical protein